ncbi:MAG: hypothetical protein IJI78_09825 [Oscillospiraceae bacterium]|nr:hypothetical protein [Oscillospiraceae bacterium]
MIKNTENIKIIICNVGWMNSYNGSTYERPRGGGSYNKTNIGHELNNFTNYYGTYYGYARAPKESIDIVRNLQASRISTYVDGVTVIWHARHYMVGYYKNARAYRKLQHLSGSILEERVF